MQRLRATQEYGVNSQLDSDSSKLRSHSSPQLLPGDHPPHHGSSSAHTGSTALRSGGSGATTTGTLVTAASDAQFQAATAVVATCNDLTRRLTQQADKARLFREQCSVLLSAGNSASLALHTALLHQQGSGMQVALLAGQVQSGLSQALTLVDKYGHASRLENLFRSTSKGEVERKMGDAAAYLGTLAEQVWDLITPDNTIKRSLLAAQPMTEDRPLGAVLMDRRRLRPACQRPITALAVLPEGDEEDGYEGCVAWASSRGIKVTRLGPTISAVMDGSVDAPPVTTLTGGSPGQLWSGHADGSVRLWSVAAAVAAAVPMKVGNTPITALAWDPTTGHTWAGTAEGEISVIRVLLDGSSGGRLELVRSLLGPEATPGGSNLPGAGGGGLTGPVGAALASQCSQDSAGSGKPLIHQQAAAEDDPGG